MYFAPQQVLGRVLRLPYYILCDSRLSAESRLSQILRRGSRSRDAALHMFATVTMKQRDQAINGLKGLASTETPASGIGDDSFFRYTSGRWMYTSLFVTV